MSKIIYKYRGNKNTVCDSLSRPKLSAEGSVTFSHYVGGNQKQYQVIISADDLLITAQRCLEQLSQISGINYKITYGGGR